MWQDNEWTLCEETLLAKHDVPGVRYASAFGLMAWGFLFLGDFWVRSNHYKLTLTPDFVAFILIAMALNILEPVTRGQWLFLLTLVMIPFSAIKFLIELGGLFSMIAALLEVAIGFATLLIVWQLCGLIRDYAKHRRDATLARMASTRRILFVINFAAHFSFILTVLLFFPLLIATVAPIAILLFVFSLFVLGLLAHLALRARSLAGRRPASGPSVTGTPVAL